MECSTRNIVFYYCMPWASKGGKPSDRFQSFSALTVNTVLIKCSSIDLAEYTLHTHIIGTYPPCVSIAL